jgi:hypothetical protein
MNSSLMGLNVIGRGCTVPLTFNPILGWFFFNPVKKNV